MSTPSRSSPPPPPPGSDAQRNQRYTHLLGRLRNRQITMEEATELFEILQAMLRQSEAARLVLVQSISAPSPGSGGRTTPALAPAAAAAPSSSDDLFLIGLLAMGAGAGLLAALTKRIQEMAPATANSPPTRSGSGGPAR